MSGERPVFQVDVLQGIIDTTSITTNLTQEVHVTTREKIELALRRTLPGYTSTEQLAASLGVFLAFGVALLTSEFQRFIGVTGAVWEGMFMAAAGASFVWFLLELRKWWRRPRLDDVVEAVLKSSDRLA